MPQSAQKPEPVSILQPQTTVNPDRVKQVRHRQVTSRSDHFSLCFSGSNCPHQLNTDDASLVLYWGETTALADRLTAILFQCCQRRPASGVTTTNYFTSIQFSFIHIASVTVGVVWRHPEPDPNKPHDEEKLLLPPANRHLGKEEGEGGKEERPSIHHTSKYINYNGPKNTPGLAPAPTGLHAPPPPPPPTKYAPLLFWSDVGVHRNKLPQSIICGAGSQVHRENKTSRK